MKQTRREFIEFLGYSTLILGSTSFPAYAKKALDSTSGLQPLQKGLSTDDLILSPGFTYTRLIHWGDAINSREKFGFNADYIAFLPDDQSNPTSGTLWVNHEYLSPLFVNGYNHVGQKTKKQIDMERATVGGSVIRIQKNSTNGAWEVLKDENKNFRLSGSSKIPFSHPILNSTNAIGTFANCAGGVTPWKTILTCEENFQDYYGDRFFGKSIVTTSKYDYQWSLAYDFPPEHYGWVVEVDTVLKTAEKLVPLGRFAHESATTVLAKDGRCVVYSGDDAANECIYKFISQKPGSLKEGTLYVANTEKGEWLPLDINQNPALKAKFKTQTDVLIWTREAAKTVGGTPQDRPEDIEINPHNGEILISLTNNAKKLTPNFFGSILKIKEEKGDYLSMKFDSSTFIAGGEATGFACPDNLAFDPAGNLWFCCDVSGTEMNKPPYTAFGNNGLFVVPHSGKFKGKAVQVASAPMDAEFTGPCFTPDGKTLFLSVQHPGEQSESLEKLTSHWPEGGNSIPKSAVVAISGSMLEMITNKIA